MNPKESNTYIVGSSDETSHYWQDLAVANRRVAEDNQTKLAAAQAEIAALKAKDLTKFEPDWVSYGQGCEDGYAAAVEQAAKVCETHQDDRNRHNYTKDAYIATLQCAAAIRAMKVEK
jgi:hypothetical protein